MIDHQQIINFDWYKGNLTWLRDRTIFLTRSGSHAYGTNTAESDEDFCGVAIAPKEYYLGFLNKFEVSETKGDPDIKIYDIRFFVELAAQCNPNIIELLYTDPIDWLISDRNNDRVWHWYWYDLYSQRELFLSKEAKARFTGYAISQLKRIKSHRSYLLNPIENQPQRKEFGLPERKTIDKEQFNIIESRIRKLEDKLGGDGFTKDRVELVDESLVESVIKDIEIDTKLIPIIIAERKYNSAMRNWNKYQEWKAGRNPKRAQMEKESGFDRKHAMHLIRLLNMGVEILRDGKVLTKRPDAEFLMSIRNGAYNYDQLMDMVAKLEAEINLAYENSKLPTTADKNKINKLLVDILESSFE